MADSIVVTGQANLVDNAGNTVIPFDLASLLGTTSNVLEHNKVKRQLVSTDNAVTLDKGGVGTVRGFFLFITEGSGVVTLKHDSNVNSMSIDKGLLIFGNLDAIIIQTVSTQPLTIEYLFFE